MLSKKIILVVGLGVLLIAGFFWLKSVEAPKLQEISQEEIGQMAEMAQVCFTETCFDVELAKTASQRAQGLMFRQSLAENRGMLFIFDRPDIYSFWMKNTLIPLDMIWLDEQGEVVDIAENVLPCHEPICPSITPKSQALYVLEIKAGMAQKLGLLVNSHLAIDFSE